MDRGDRVERIAGGAVEPRREGVRRYRSSADALPVQRATGGRRIARNRLGGRPFRPHVRHAGRRSRHRAGGQRALRTRRSRPTGTGRPRVLGPAAAGGAHRRRAHGGHGQSVRLVRGGRIGQLRPDGLLSGTPDCGGGGLQKPRTHQHRRFLRFHRQRDALLRDRGAELRATPGGRRQRPHQGRAARGRLSGGRLCHQGGTGAVSRLAPRQRIRRFREPFRHCSRR